MWTSLLEVEQEQEPDSEEAGVLEVGAGAGALQMLMTLSLACLLLAEKEVIWLRNSRSHWLHLELFLSYLIGLSSVVVQLLSFFDHTTVSWSYRITQSMPL